MPQQGQVLVGLDPFEVGEMDAVGDVHGPALKLDRAARGLRDRPDDQRLEVGLLAVIVLEALEGYAVRLLPTDELEGTGPHRVLGGVALLHGLLVDDARPRLAQGVKEGGDGAPKVELDGVAVQDLHVLEVLDQGMGGSPEGGLSPVEGELHVIRGAFLAVVEFDPLADVEHVARRRRLLPALCQHGLQGAVRGDEHQVFKHLEQDVGRDVLRTGERIEDADIRAVRYDQGILGREGRHRYKAQGQGCK